MWMFNQRIKVYKHLTINKFAKKWKYDEQRFEFCLNDVVDHVVHLVGFLST